MLWFTLGLMLGGFLGMLVMGIFASKRRSDVVYGDKMDYNEKDALSKASRRVDNSGANNNTTPSG